MTHIYTIIYKLVVGRQTRFDDGEFSSFHYFLIVLFSSYQSILGIKILAKKIKRLQQSPVLS